MILGHRRQQGHLRIRNAHRQQNCHVERIAAENAANGKIECTQTDRRDGRGALRKRCGETHEQGADGLKTWV